MSWSTREVVTISIAVVGAILGIINTVFAVWQKRVRLRVRVMMAFDPADEDLGSDGLPREQSIAVEVTNLSGFPVTIQTVGFVLDSWLRRMMKRVPVVKLMAGDSPGYLMIKNPQITGRALPERTLPARLDSRESLVALGNPGAHEKADFRRVRRGFALTACGVTRTCRFPKAFLAKPPGHTVREAEHAD